MKKIFLTLFVFISVSFAATNEQIIEHFKTQIGLSGLKYEVTSRIKIKDYPEYERVVLVIGQESNTTDIHHNTTKQELKIIVRDNMIFPEAVDVIKNRSLLEE